MFSDDSPLLGFYCSSIAYITVSIMENNNGTKKRYMWVMSMTQMAGIANLMKRLKK